MRLRPSTTTSERELVRALAAGGRRVSLEDLVTWRKDGLLPPLASHGVRGAGRCYYWREPDIQAQAETVHDALKRHGRGDSAAVSLWLRGFDVALPQLRRAWLHRGRRNAQARIRRAPGKVLPAGPSGNGLSDILLSACHAAAACVENPHAPMKASLAVLERAFASLGWIGEKREIETHWRLVTAMLLLLGTTDAVSAASDEELREAQGHLCTALDFLTDFRNGESADTVIDSLGPPVFLFMVTLLRSGQQELLDRAMTHIAIIRRAPAAQREDRPYAVTADHAHMA